MMKNLLTTLLCGSLWLMASAQQTTHTWDFDGVSRKYIQYVPAIYTGNEAVPLLISLHGLGDNMNNFTGVGFHAVADTADMIVVTPEALVDQVFSNATAWNSGAGVLGISLNADVDDVGFISAIIDTVSAHYNIDPTRIFATGFSMGGFMSNRLACELNDRISAIASVAGTVGGELNCTPGQAISVCHFHGTDDTQVGYGMAGGGVQDNTFGSNAPDWVNFWNSNNGCGAISLEGAFPNTASDGYDVEYVEYGGCTNDSRVVHYKVNGADHVWLFPNNDIFYTVEIWKFFLGLSPTNLVPASVDQEEKGTLGLYPNPVSDMLFIKTAERGIRSATVYNAMGQRIFNIPVVGDRLDVSNLRPGLYQVMVETGEGLSSGSFVKE